MMNSNCNCKWGGCNVSMIVKILLIIGGINWGLIGVGVLMGSISNWNVVHMILGSMPIIEGIVYVLVGVAAVLSIFGCKCKTCIATCTSCSNCQTKSAD